MASSRLTAAAGTSTISISGKRDAQIGMEQRLLVGERLLVREQHMFVGDRDDIVVERAGGDRLVRLADEDRAFGIEAMVPRDRLARDRDSGVRGSGPPVSP